MLLQLLGCGLTTNGFISCDSILLPIQNEPVLTSQRQAYRVYEISTRLSFGCLTFEAIAKGIKTTSGRDKQESSWFVLHCW
jgi:hypothetical protein